MWTAFRCPIRWTRSMACKSTTGFQSCSSMITVSTAVRFSPTPPARVEASSTSADPRSACGARWTSSHPGARLAGGETAGGGTSPPSSGSRGAVRRAPPSSPEESVARGQKARGTGLPRRTPPSKAEDLSAACPKRTASPTFANRVASSPSIRPRPALDETTSDAGAATTTVSSLRGLSPPETPQGSAVSAAAPQKPRRADPYTSWPAGPEERPSSSGEG
eukprot:scaffold7392_cov286-Pinguiococcus_pyrenoidosus.AAC.25